MSAPFTPYAGVFWMATGALVHALWRCGGNLGPMGKEQIERAEPEAVDVVRAESACDAKQWKSYYESLDAQRGPTAYLFKCRHCGKLGGYSDSH